MSWQPRAPVTRRVLAGLCEGDAPWAGVSEAGPALTGGSRPGLGWQWQDNAQLAARPPAERAHSPNCPSCSSAREPLGGPWHSNAACASPGSSRLGHVGGLSGYHDARGRAGWWVRAGVAAAVAAMQGPLAGSAAAAGGPGGPRQLALRPRPGEPRPRCWPTGTSHIRDHEEHGE